MTCNRWHMRLLVLLLLAAAMPGCYAGYLLGHAVEDWKGDRRRHQEQRERAKTITEEQESLIRQDRKLASKGLDRAFERLAVRIRYHTQRMAFGLTDDAPYTAQSSCRSLVIYLNGEIGLAMRILRTDAPERVRAELFVDYCAQVHRIVADEAPPEWRRLIDSDELVRRGDEFAALLEALPPDRIDGRFRERYDEAVEREEEHAVRDRWGPPPHKSDPLGLHPLEP
ncbi:MAG: hypothetical protein IT364_10305 [Candidatus Hydrogenedentes bacterium]|nr:hypothetical protein [Candidatus Hydrogenedentota bacterium]